MSRRKTKDLQSYTHDGTTYLIDETVLLNSEDSPVPGRIVSFHDAKKGPQKVTVKLFYRVTDFPRGVKVPQRALENEVYVTDKEREFSVSSIRGPCAITEVAVNEPPEEVDPFSGDVTPFFTRYHYDWEKQVFAPLKNSPLVDLTVPVRQSKKRRRGDTEEEEEKKGSRKGSRKGSSKSPKQKEKVTNGETKSRKKQVKKAEENGVVLQGENMIIVQPNPDAGSYSEDFPFWVAQNLTTKKNRKRLDVIWYEAKTLLGSYAPCDPIQQVKVHTDAVIVNEFSLKSDGHLPEDIIDQISAISPNGWTKDSVATKQSEVKKSSGGKKSTETVVSSPSKPIDMKGFKVKNLAREAITALEIPDFKLAAKKLKLAYFILEPPLIGSPSKSSADTSALSPSPTPSPLKVVEKEKPKARRGRKPKSSQTQSSQTQSSQTQLAKPQRRRRKTPDAEVATQTDQTDENGSPKRRSGRLEGQTKSYSPTGLIQQRLLNNLKPQAPKLKSQS